MKGTHQAHTPLPHQVNEAQKNGHVSAGASEWSYRNNPAVRELLKHLAKELAREYVQLMEASTQREETSQ